LHKEVDITDNNIEETISLSIALANTDREKSHEKIQDFLAQVPNLWELSRLRFSLLHEDILELSHRLTSGKVVDSTEIEKANK
jgi:hypothetical protein